MQQATKRWRLIDHIGGNLEQGILKHCYPLSRSHTDHADRQPQAWSNDSARSQPCSHAGCGTMAAKASRRDFFDMYSLTLDMATQKMPFITMDPGRMTRVTSVLVTFACPNIERWVQ